MNPPTDPPPAPPGTSTLWQDYLDRGQGYDETRDARGRVRPGWDRFFSRLGDRDGAVLGRLRDAANRQLRDHGATFHLHAAGDVDPHPWRLDPVPLLIGHEEWRGIEAGLEQRARLLSLVLSDLYGPRDLVRTGLVPQDLVLRHPGYQRACWGAVAGGDHALFHYAADLARGPGGAMWVVNDRTGIPAGAGYALENRTIMGRLFPEEIHALQVERLSGSFRALRAGLGALAPAGAGQPRIVLYTPGPYSPAYFEHAFLAAYLGYTLVQGDDLLVRGGRAWLKALEGLQPVDVIIRRVTDPYCDPLELDERSQLGVPGLLEAVRRGTVAVANQVGSDLLENLGLVPFLPGLARALLGEDLRLPTAATWWCGQPRERQHVLAHLDELVIRTVDRRPVDPTDGLGPYTAGQRRALSAAIEAEPWRYVGQERVGFSTMPVLVDGRLEPRATTLRAFVTHDGHGYHVMPGGLARCGDSGQTYLPPDHLGGTCKDTWVLAPGPVAHRSLWLEHRAAAPERPLAGFFTSSAVENLFWTGRCADRAGCLIHTLRVLLQTYDQDMQSGSDTASRCLDHLWQGFLAQAGRLPPGPRPPLAEPPTLRDLAAAAFDPEAAGGLTPALGGFVRAAFSVREHWSKDTWRIINRVEERTGSAPDVAAPYLLALQDALDGQLLLLQAFAGQCADNMTRTAGWLFLELGRRLEHALMMVNLLAGALAPPRDELTEYYLLEALLEANESLVTYRRAYRTTPALGDVLSLLLAQERNPKSLVYQLREVEACLSGLHRETGLAAVGALAPGVGEAARRLAGREGAGLCPGAPPLADRLHDLRDRVLQPVAESLSHACFKHALARTRPLVRAGLPAGDGA